MSTLEVETFDLDRRRSWLADLATRWPIWPCLLLSLLFMMATNNPEATSRWQETTRAETVKLTMNLESGRATRQLSFVLLALWGAWSLVWPGGRRVRLSPALAYGLLVFLAWAAASVLWSYDKSFTVKRLFVLGCMTLAVAGFVKRYRLRDLALLALIGGALQMFASIAADLLWSTGHYGQSGYRFSGLQHPNHSGINAVLLSFACLYFFDRTKLKRFFMLLLVALVILYLTKSRSALIAGVAGMTMFALLRWPLKKVAMAAVGIGVAAGMAAVLIAADVLPANFSAMLSMGREDAAKTALTGRPAIWEAALQLFGDEPTRRLVGVGYQSFWTPERAAYVTDRLWFHISEGHNAFFDLMLELGLVGSVCYGLLILFTFTKWTTVAYLHKSRPYAFAAAVMAFIVVHSLTESTTLAPNFVTFFNYACLGFLAFRGPAWLPMPREDDDVAGFLDEEGRCAS